MSQLELKNLKVRFVTRDGTVAAVNGVSFSLERGETLGLVGETGAGKTTTALSILRLIQSPPGEIYEGEILLEGEDLLKKSDQQMRRIRGGKIAMIFQDPMTALNPVLTVEDQIAENFRAHNAVSKAESIHRAHEMLEMVGIPADRGCEYPHQFSGGMKQRVVIAMALACSPELLLADEPTTALDVTIQAQVLGMMNELKNTLGTSMILITHDLGVVAETCDKVAIMYAGEIVEYGNLQHIFNNGQHPYTEGLFGSLPNMKKNVKRLTPIEGLMPNPRELPEGCKFHPRCRYATEACSCSVPPYTEIEPGHMVRCFRARAMAGGTENE